MWDIVHLKLETIEKLRQEMYSLAEAKGISAVEVLIASQRLDVALSEYNRILDRNQALRPIGQ